MSAGAIRFGTPAGRWILAATVLGSGVAFLDGTVVNVALPAIAEDLDAGVSGLQWTLDAYLVTLSALLLLGGSLGDVFGRRRLFVAGLAGFVLASLLCGVAPSVGTLVAARALQGVGAACLVPGSLAIISASFRPEDRSRAVGAWSGLAGVTSALGPFLGGWLIDAVSWRLVFLINLPVAAVTAWITLRHVPESRDEDATGADVPGAVAATAGLAGLAYALIEGAGGVGAAEIVSGVLGVAGLAAFLVLERRSRRPMLPLELFRSAQFSGANLTTFAVYAGLGGALFLVVLRLQLALGYSALAAGTSLLPLTVLMLVLSSRAGQLAQRIGPRLPMTAGPLVAGAGLFLLGRVAPGTGYVTTVLPGVVVFGLGLTLTVAPLTAAVLAAADERHLGAASGFNNAVARLAGLIAVAVVPGLAGIDAALAGGYTTAMRICAAVCAAGGIVAFLTVRSSTPVATRAQPDAFHPCQHPCVREDERVAAA